MKSVLQKMNSINASLRLVIIRIGLLALYLTVQVVPTFGQYTNSSLNEETKGRPIKAAKDQAEKYKSNGWNVYNDFMAFDLRLQTTWVIENEVNDKGASLYSTAEGNTIASSRNAAHHQAVDWAKLRLARETAMNGGVSVEPIPEDAERNFLIGEIIENMPDEVKLTYKILNNIKQDYIFKITRELQNVHEVSVKLFFERKKLEVFSRYATEIISEMDKSELFRPKDEFESHNQYNERQKQSYEFEKSIYNKYLQTYVAQKKEKDEAAEEEKKKIIRDSYQKVNLRIEHVGVYNADKQIFPITINGKTRDVKISPDIARGFKNNIDKVRVYGEKQLGPDGKQPEIFNIQIVEPVSGNNYLFGKQRSPLYLNEEQLKIASEKTVDNKNGRFISGSAIKKFQPPHLEIESPKFRDVNNNNRIDAMEQFFIDFNLNNKGLGDAFDLKIDIKMLGDTSGIKLELIPGNADIRPGGSQKYTIGAKSTMDLQRGKLAFRIGFVEKNGFDTKPFDVTINTLEFQKPFVKIADFKFLNGKEEKKIIETGEPVQLKLIVQNSGQGIAENINIHFGIPKLNVFMITDNNLSIGRLKPGDSREVSFEFVANKRFSSSMLPIEITLTEKYRQFAENSTLTTKVNQVEGIPVRYDIISEKFQEKVIEPASLTPDVDQNIPVTGINNEFVFAMIVGNEDYSSNNESINLDANVNFAENDARIFKEYLIKTLGIPEKNIELLINATSAEMNKGIARLNTLGKVYGEKAELLVYYAGHGLANDKTKEAFLIPSDIDGLNLKHAIKINDMYESLGKLNTKKTTVFIDACFSGGARNQSILPSSVNETIVFGGNNVSGNIVEFIASSGDQTAYAYHEKQHGLFTYYLLKQLQLHGGNISFKSLLDKVSESVKKLSMEKEQRMQTPVVNYSEKNEKLWKSWRLR